MQSKFEHGRESKVWSKAETWSVEVQRYTELNNRNKFLFKSTKELNVKYSKAKHYRKKIDLALVHKLDSSFIVSHCIGKVR